MSDKLIDGSINIDDKASGPLSKIEIALKNLEKIAKPVTDTMRRLNFEINQMKTPITDKGRIFTQTQKNLSKVEGFNDLSKSRQFSIIEKAVNNTYKEAAANQLLSTKSILSDLRINEINAKAAAKNQYFDRLDANASLRALNRQASITQQEGLRMMRQEELIKHQKDLAQINNQARLAQIAEKEASAKRLADYKAELALKSQQAKMEQKLAQQEAKIAKQVENRTDWQKRMATLSARGGKLQPLWEAFGKATSPLNLARSPHLVTEGLGGVFGKMGNFGKGVGGFVTGRMIGGLLGSSTIGGIIGGAAGGPVGIAVATVGTLLLAGFKRIGDKISSIIDILNTISSERATESTSLRRKMQMSSEMFGINPTNIKEIDEKIYGLRKMEQEYYKHGMSGRDITSSAIDWIHLLGTKETGGVFADEKQAFDFSAALSAIAKMNGLSDQEYETVRYQGMQILSKGYADILDVKPLLNSAPGFVRDLLQQTGMSRKEFLESGRTHSFTSDKFINALMNVKDYYEVLSDRASSRTAESQKEAADNIIGAAGVWDEQYKKVRAESNTEVANAVIQAGITNHIKESWYKMWSDANDAQDGINEKVKFEKDMTSSIWLFINDIYTAAVVIKNVFDIVADVIVFIAKEIYAVIRGIFDMIVNGFASLMAWLWRQVADLPGFNKEEYLKMAEDMDPNSETNKKKRMYEAAAEAMADQIIKADLAGGREKLSKDFPELFNDNVVVAEELTFDRIPDKKEITVVYADADPYKTAFNWRPEDIGRGYLVVSPDGPNSGMKSKRIEEDWSHVTKVPRWTPIINSEFNEDKLKRIVYTGLNANNETSRAADRTSLVANIQKELESGGISINDDVAKRFKLLGGNLDDYRWQNIALSRPGQYWREFQEDVRQDRDDIKNALAQREKTREEARQALENVKAPYIPKIAGDVQNIKNSVGKGNAKILDILKEIAGITVINKVTRVRPDVVFNFGSYGRSGMYEDPNLRAVGDKLNSFYNEEEHKVSVNGVPVLNEAG